MTVIAADNDITDPSARKVYIGTNNYKAGRAAGELVAKVLPKGGKIAIFVGVMDATNAIERRQGVLDYLAGRKQDEMTRRDPADARNLAVGSYVLLDTRTDDEKENICQEKAEDLLSTNPDVDCLIGLWEYNPPALLRAVRNFKGKTKPFIVAFDENFETMRGIQSGEIVGSVAQNPYKFGYDSVRILAHLIKGEDKVLKEYTMDENNRIYIEHTVVTKDGGGAGTAKVDDFFANLKKLKGE
jgi:ribose transport system substrate-binding protein